MAFIPRSYNLWDEPYASFGDNMVEFDKAYSILWGTSGIALTAKSFTENALEEVATCFLFSRALPFFCRATSTGSEHDTDEWKSTIGAILTEGSRLYLLPESRLRALLAHIVLPSVRAYRSGRILELAKAKINSVTTSLTLDESSLNDVQFYKSILN